jgi:hypothetical protein
MLRSQEAQEERRRVMQNDQRVKEQQQTGTMFSHTHDDIHQGRFASIGPATVVGSTQFPSYPAASAHQHDPCGPEPPLGHRVDAMPELEELSTGLLHSPVATGEPMPDGDAPSKMPVELPRPSVGSPLFRRRV